MTLRSEKPTIRPKPLVLIILDGWGYREEEDANAIASATKPVWDKLWAEYPHATIFGSGLHVGLPNGQMGNSEVGHVTMGAGRVVYQDLTRIDLAIKDQSFFKNPVLIDAIKLAKAKQKTIHLIGLVSPGGVHSHENHIKAMINLVAQYHDQLSIHAFTDGRDTPPQSALASLTAIQDTCEATHTGKIVSIIGRYYAMDRDKRWDRIQSAYELLVSGKAVAQAENVTEAIHAAYARGETDEFITPTVIHAAGASPSIIQDGDVVFFMNFRADRARELTHAFVDKHFNAFKRKIHPELSAFVCLTEYDRIYNLPVAFPPESHQDILADVLSREGLTQLRLAETEKYAHVTFFFNGGVEAAYPGEDRLLVPSPKVATYDLQPEMSAIALTDELVKAIESKHYDVIICNFANPDMVGHTGNFKATVLAIETIDKCLGRICDSLQKVSGEALITADHGNAELMFDEKTQQAHTAHTNYKVPLIYFGRPAKINPLEGKLSDISPTLLYLLGLKKPDLMTGKSLLQLQ